jgi:hypothetical protein
MAACRDHRADVKKITTCPASFICIQASRKPSVAVCHVHSRHRRREIVQMFLIPPTSEDCVTYLAARQLELLKSLDDLDEEEDEDEDEDEDIDDLDDEEDEDDLDEDFEDDEDEDEDDDEDEEEDEEEDGGVKPLKM